MTDVTSRLPEDAICKTIVVPLHPEDAFALFTTRIGSWWPVQQFSVAVATGDTVAEVVVEPRVGGAIYEIAASGTRADWGRVTHWEPGVAFHMDWWPGHGPDVASQVAVSFALTEAGTRVELVHSGLSERPDGAALIDQYTSGWDLVLSKYTGAA